MQRDRLLIAEMIEAAERIVEWIGTTSGAELALDRDGRDAVLWNSRSSERRPTVSVIRPVCCDPSWGGAIRCDSGTGSCTGTRHSTSTSWWPLRRMTCRRSPTGCGRWRRNSRIPPSNAGRTSTDEASCWTSTPTVAQSDIDAQAAAGEHADRRLVVLKGVVLPPMVVSLQPPFRLLLDRKKSTAVQYWRRRWRGERTHAELCSSGHCSARPASATAACRQSGRLTANFVARRKR